MTPERWRRTEELYHAASTRPPGERAAFLAEACQDDEALRREVESLLSETVDAGFLAGPALLAASQLVPDREPAAMTGQSLGGYHLQSLLGAGGMGEVYQARDSKLGRDVAIKILPRAFTSDPDRLARFEREARLLAALNHPNICAIYGLEETDPSAASEQVAVRFLVLELIAGPTLADRIAGAAEAAPLQAPRSGGASAFARASADRSAPPMPLEEILRIARQIAGALEVAHDKGIIHRDLKPANIKITPEGVVKVLDFGLAKAVTSDGATPDLTQASGVRRDGVLIGTASYMSPEQARGLTVDKRTDIWAFGCVLYQMLTGRIPFAGDTVSDTIARILEREPDWSALPPTTPAALRRLLIRCLTKDPKQRLRDIGDVRIEIDAIDDARDANEIGSPPVSSRSATRWLPWVALVALAVAAGVRETTRSAVSLEERLANARFTRLTSWDGAEEGAAISPDGTWVAFLSNHDGEYDIWVSQISSGGFSNLTRDFPPLVASGSIVRKLGFSATGAEIWFNPQDRKPLLLMPLTGGPPRVLLSAGMNTPAWSPTGDRMVFFGKPPDGADPMYIADRTGADARQLFTPQGALHSNNPAWSADGRWIYYVSGSEPQDEMDINIWRVSSAGGSPERLTDLHAAVNFLAPIDARTLLYVARAEDGSGPWLWALDIERKVPHRVPAGVDQFTSVASSRDGSRVVATIAHPSADLWRVPLLDRVAEERDAQPYPIPVPTGRVRAPRFAGASMFYLATRGTRDGLWKVQGDQATEVWRDADGALFEPPAVSPDGRRVAVVVRREGKRHLSIMSADGTTPRTLAPSIEIEGAAGQGAASWSPDGAWIVAGGRDAQGPALFKIPVEGGNPERLVDGKFVNPIWSPRGDLIVYAGRSIVGLVTLLGVRPDGTAVELPQVSARPGGYRFLSDGSGLVYLPHIHARDFWRLDLATQQQRQLTRLDDRGRLSTFDITPDGKQIVFDRSRENSDIVLIDLPAAR